MNGRWTCVQVIRTGLACCLAALLLASVSPAAAQSASEEEAVRLRFADYELKLNALLKTRRDEEKAFLHDVLTLVRQGDLPESVVEMSFKWVLNKRPDTNYPFIYFERVLRIRAKELKLDIPDFDYEIYRVRPDRR